MIQSILFFICSSSLFALAGSRFVGHLTPTMSALSLIFAFAFCVVEYRQRTLKLDSPKVSPLVQILYFLIIGGIYAHSVFLFYLKDGAQYWIQNVSNLGDLSFHWSVIRNLAKGASFWPENPIYLGYRFRYPFGLDFFNALFENLGVAISTHLPLVTLVGLLITMGALHLVGGPLLVFAIFFSAGFYNFVNPPNWSLFELQSGLDFKSMFLTVLINQRGFLYALPVGLLLYKAVQKNFAKEWSPNLFEKVTLGILWGSLGFFHLHSYMLVSLYLGLLILWRRELKTWLVSLGVAFVVGMIFVINALLPEAGTNSLIHWSRGWARPEDVNYFAYWFKNLGPWLMAVGGALVIFYRQKKWHSFVPTALALGLFILFAHLILAPWDWDNIKLILWCYIFALLAIQDLLWNQRPPLVKALVFVFFCWPGMMLFVHSLPHATRGNPWVSERELNKATVLLKGQNVNEGLVVAPEYEHPALLLGHKLYMGYPGHVWSHGYNYGERERLLNRYFLGESGAVEAFPKDQVKLFYQGPLEKRRENEVFSTKGLSKIGEALDHELYRFE